MKAAKPILLSLLLAALLAACGDDSSTGSGGGDSSEELSSGTSFVPGSSDEGDSSEELSSDEETSGSSSSRVGKSSAKVSSSSSSPSSSSSDDGGFCGVETYDSATQLCDHRDSAIYDIVRIGNQIWMKENLNFDYKVDGASYGSYCYNNSADSCAKYGRLYTWAAAMDSATTYCGFGKSCTATHPVQGICPSGWHLPDTTDWHDLIVAAGGQYSAGAKLKSTSGWENDGWGNDGNGTDAFGFSALPSGYRSRGGEDYYTAGGYACIWSSFEYITGLVAYQMDLRSTNAYAYVDRSNEDYGYAVRCVKD